MKGNSSIISDDNTILFLLILITIIILIVSLFICAYAWYISHNVPQRELQERFLSQNPPRFMRGDQYLPTGYGQFTQFSYPPQYYGPQMQFGIPQGMPQVPPGTNMPPGWVFPQIQPQPEKIQQNSDAAEEDVKEDAKEESPQTTA
ncbi:hypothetical protein TVAG_027660 [Trichomonas vaginalis G3]|uniref:Uncharacterized protein n=1 Tax=Trichomonas vaginalis (strain ATCC PRA-98 / G3) TaxID=412133 RepID=A2E505_TRIV3|nr:hypothetical protein TVAGG3_0420360 [Trichomonas vaginalis G3]EAY12213.1 hypothetical protein TVAG_027660 [Trichomonas vaginalis G3]KAI5535999.1 hypothetical protein TVAGG3_0420360 [Trichomonas vaginalis G3]|eukprot:XP_001324436.1 hypothetical protein [Trichomonas vaginalis G3]